VPGPVPLLRAQDATTLDWSPVLDAAGGDVVRGDLGLLSSTGGDFVLSTTTCVANDQATTPIADAAEPPLGSGFIFLARGENRSGSGTYDTGSPGQIGSRDAEVDAAPITCALGACPCWPGGPQEIAALHAATHPITSCNIFSAAYSPTQSYTAYFSYNGAVQDEFDTQVFTGFFGWPVGQNYCQSYSSCSDQGGASDQGIWKPPVDADLPITPGESSSCIQAFEAAQVIKGCNETGDDMRESRARRESVQRGHEIVECCPVVTEAKRVKSPASDGRGKHLTIRSFELTYPRERHILVDTLVALRGARAASSW